ncbi:TIGR00341 family protein [Halobacteria archaeon AArc-m2/3/4]|uniref:TIGR00341 family protein n=1 Tax=Natronoglomus mannanivorans TaxID=2979990 RepID=A0ABT2Q9C8_9EURY|nr:TIGR00341 family protein [Halobacteria archaeon AArc-m2/3/4]
MRLVQVFVPRGKYDLVLETLDRDGIEYAVTDAIGHQAFEAIVSVPVSPSGVEPLLSSLSEAGLDEDAYTAVLAAETVVSDRTGHQHRDTTTRISREELRARASDLAPALSTYLALLVLSTTIATAGLLLDSAATIIGAMVVAPLMGPALSASVGVVVNDERLASRGVLLQAGGLLAVIATAAIIGFALRGTVLLPPGFDVASVPEVRERITPDVLALGLALGSGAAGVISLTRNVGSVLVGVAIAVALVPPAATVGLGIAWGHPSMILTAGTLVLVNLLSINLTALLLLWASGYRPQRPEHAEHAFRTLVSRVAVLAVAITLLSVVLAGVTIGTYQTASVEHDVQTELEAMSDDPAFGDLQFREVSVDYELIDVYADRRPVVTVLVERSPGESEPSTLAETVRDCLQQATDADPRVTVELVDTQYSE